MCAAHDRLPRANRPLQDRLRLCPDLVTRNGDFDRSLALTASLLSLLARSLSISSPNRTPECLRNSVRPAQAALDGLYVIRTSQGDLSAEDVVRSYKQLTRAESTFLYLKTVDLQVRPIRHHSERVRAHPLLCLLACYVEWRLRQALAELLFEDEGSAGWRAGAASSASNEAPPSHGGGPGTAQLPEVAADARHPLSPSMPPAGPRQRRHSGAADGAERLAGACPSASGFG